MTTFYTYPKCGTCRKTKNWLENHEIMYDEIHIVEQTPSAEKLKELLDISGLEVKKFFNTNGARYRELELKDKIDEMSQAEALQLLASDGMLIKRPIVATKNVVTVGFNEEVFEQTWLKETQK